MRKPAAPPRNPAPRAVAVPLPRRRSYPTGTAASRQRERIDPALLFYAGWVGTALIMLMYLPVWEAENRPKTRTTTARRSTTESVKAPVLVNDGSDRAVIFAGGSDSLVARTVGHAEGTRTPNGRRTRAYYGHTDPGNGVWNLGSFSFQHCREAQYNCTTPQQADEHQLLRLQKQTDRLRQQAAAIGLAMTLEEELNGIDLTNQSPRAALSEWGYADRLLQAKQRGLKGQDAILEARVWSYWNPKADRWNAPGLGNTEAGIRHDQQRRMLAIARALSVYQQQAAAPTSNLIDYTRSALRPEPTNPYNPETQKAQFLWWESGYWDAALGRSPQIASGTDAAYDQGFTAGK